MCYALRDTNILFAGGSRDGLGDLDRGAAGRRHERLHGLAQQARQAQRDEFICPATAGDQGRRRASSTTTILHRKAREASILHRLGNKGETDIPTIVRAIYIGNRSALTGAAGLSVLAHLEDLVARGVVATDGQRAVDGVFRLAR